MEDLNWREMLEMADKIGKMKEMVEIFQDEATINVPLEFPRLPMVLGFPSDSHLFSENTNHALYRKHIDIALSYPNVFLAPAGDEVEFALWTELKFQQVLPIWLQGMNMKALAKELNGENERGRPIVLFRCGGNHTWTLLEISGHSWEAIFYGLDKDIKDRAPIFPTIGLAHLNVGEQQYDIGMAHKHTGHSSLNPTLAAKRLMEYRYPNADIAVVGHHHILAVEEFIKGGKDRIAIRPGTYRSKGHFEKRHGWAVPPQEGMAAVMLYPDKKKMKGYKYFEDAIEDLHEKYLLRQI